MNFEIVVVTRPGAYLSGEYPYGVDILRSEISNRYKCSVSVSDRFSLTNRKSIYLLFGDVKLVDENIILELEGDIFYMSARLNRLKSQLEKYHVAGFCDFISLMYDFPKLYGRPHVIDKMNGIRCGKDVLVGENLYSEVFPVEEGEGIVKHVFNYIEAYYSGGNLNKEN